MTHQATRILLAAPDMPFLHATAQVLRGAGYICDCASDAREAMAALEAQPYDLLIADINMPGNRELELVCASQSYGCSVPAIVMTGSPTVSTAVRSLHLAVVVEYLIKPVDASQLLRCVELAVATGRFWRVGLRAYDELRTRVGDTADLERSTTSPELPQRAVTGLAWSLENYLEQTVSHIAQIAWSLKGTLDAVQQGCPLRSTDVCALLSCPRLSAYEESLRDTITVLRKTKNAFKSKELGELRGKLEKLLENARPA